MSFNKKDISQIEEKGITPQKVEQQIEIFRRGNIVVNVREAATVRNGILDISTEEKEGLIRFYDDKKEKLNILKFVPASGAATRMFKTFYNFLKEFHPEQENLEDYIDRKNDPNLESFFRRLEDLPFYEEIEQKLKKDKPGYEDLSEDKQKLIFVRFMLEEQGLDLGAYPKGLVPFHKYKDHSATAFEEHLIEAADYASSQGKVRIHFTVSEEHLEKFKAEEKKVRARVEKETGVKFEISYSFQDPKTDTVAVTMENEPFRDENGEIFFRPGGHGALIENLNNQDADLIFIKNIDNVVVPRNRDVLIKNKKMLAGKLIKLQEKVFNLLRVLDQPVDEKDLPDMIDFVQNQLNSGLSIKFDELSKEEKISELKRKLNRPIRVCGMVKNEGEPGGGPFWITHKNGEISLQIVESSQIDHENYQQSKIAREATHFNPVDVVCGFKNYKGQKFNLHDFVDEETSFIAEKTKDGKELKALELPGLWNGGMSDWISIFVEVPVQTFNPVKTVVDLLKPTHQVK